MNEDIEILFARMTIHEMLHEIHFANIFAAMPDARRQFDYFKQDFIESISFKAEVSDATADPQTAQRVQERAIEIARNFLRKTEERLIERLRMSE